MRYRLRVLLTRVIAVNTKPIGAIAVLLCVSACAVQPVPKERGVRLYRPSCASCHGIDARGHGDLAPLLKGGVPDLTTLSQRNGGIFPTYTVRRSIDGRFDSSAHGTREMPVWGWQLYDPGVHDTREARARTDALVDELVEYLQSLQK